MQLILRGPKAISFSSEEKKLSLSASEKSVETEEKDQVFPVTSSGDLSYVA